MSDTTQETYGGRTYEEARCTSPGCTAIALHGRPRCWVHETLRQVDDLSHLTWPARGGK